MTARMQKRLAIGAALLVVVIVFAANAHLLVVAVGSQPGCMAASAVPAKPAC